jgi:hypothetical protein
MLFRVHKNTVRNWLDTGLQPIDNRRPILILGRQLSSFLYARRARRRRHCAPGQFYCMRCRAPKSLADQMAEYLPITSRSGNLKGTCSDCGTRMCRRVALRKIKAVAGEVQVKLPQAQERIEDTSCPCLNSDLVQEPETHANAQSGK